MSGTSAGSPSSSVCLLENFVVDKSTYAEVEIKAAFYPKFENENSDKEKIREKMKKSVSDKKAVLEVTLKHSGSLFMYAGNKGGAYAKNSFRNKYTAVGLFVLHRTFHESWGSESKAKQAQFSEFLETNRMCVSMELVTAVLGDHGQHPIEDYVVVTAVTKLGNGKPSFFSTHGLVTFCREWRIPTNHVWKSVTKFFKIFDDLCEEGTATQVCEALRKDSDKFVAGSADHIKLQGELLEGLVARLVGKESLTKMEALDNHPPPEEAGLDSGPSLREIWNSNTDERERIEALLQSVIPDSSDWFQTEEGNKDVVDIFLKSQSADIPTSKLQEMIRTLLEENRFQTSVKCYPNFRATTDSEQSDNLLYKMVIHVRNDSGFREYRKEMSKNKSLWPLYRGFFFDINLFKADDGKAAKIAKSMKKTVNDNETKDCLADDDSNLMIKMKFFEYKIRVTLIRNGLPKIFKDDAYKIYCLKQMKKWDISKEKKAETWKMLEKWDDHIRGKYENEKQLPSSTYLTEAEPFLKVYKSSILANQSPIENAGSSVGKENSAIEQGGKDEDGVSGHKA